MGVRFGFFFPVAQATSHQDDEHHHQHPKAEQNAVADVEAGIATEERGGGFLVRDPWEIAVLFVTPQGLKA